MFVPLDENEKKYIKEPCRSREHFPPTHIYINHPTKWVCASCGESFIINPTTVYCGKMDDSLITISGSEVGGQNSKVGDFGSYEGPTVVCVK